MNTIYQTMLLVDSRDLMIELWQIKGKLVTHQTTRTSDVQKACISSPKMVDRNNSTKLNKSINRYISRHVIFSQL